MLNPRSLPSTVLQVACFVLRILIVLNWLYGAAILALLVISLVNEPWLLSAFKLTDPAAGGRILMGLRAIMLLGLSTIPLNRTLLKKLLAIADTVRLGDPFVAANARRLHTIGWVLVGQNLISIVIGAISTSVSTTAYPVHLDAGFSISGWLAVLLTFVLAQVFAEGTLMREDLEGTV